MKNNEIEKTFNRNVHISGLEDRIKAIKGSSTDILIDFIRTNQKFDFIYIDGSHKCLDAYSDIILAWSLLSNGGIFVIDDYYLGCDKLTSEPFEYPFYAVNHFLENYSSELIILNKGYRVFLEKINPRNSTKLDILKIGAHTGAIINDYLYNSVNSNMNIIFVEPVPKYYDKLIENYNAKYPNNHFKYLNKAVSNFEGQIKIYYPLITNNFTELPWWIEQLAGTNPDHFKSHGYDVDLDCIDIPATTINQIVIENNIKSIDYLSIDTEGHDYDILMALDFNLIKPILINFEHIHMDGYKTQGEKYAKLVNHLIKNGYELLHKNDEDTCFKLK